MSVFLVMGAVITVVTLVIDRAEKARMERHIADALDLANGADR